MIYTVPSSQIKLIETFTHQTLVVSHHLVNQLIFDLLLLNEIPRRHQTISLSHISKSHMLSFKKTFL